MSGGSRDRVEHLGVTVSGVAAQLRSVVGRLTLAIAISTAGIAVVVTLFVYDGGSHDEGSAYSAIAEVQDSPIEELVGNRPGTIHRAKDGLFHAALTANGHALHCIVDTGASAMVLSASDGRRLGLNPAHFNGRVHTAGGSHQAARSRIADLALAGHSFRNVPAIVVRGESTPCLLGQNLLARLDAVEMHGNSIVLR